MFTYHKERAKHIFIHSFFKSLFVRSFIMARDNGEGVGGPRIKKEEAKRGTYRQALHEWAMSQLSGFACAGAVPRDMSIDTSSTQGGKGRRGEGRTLLGRRCSMPAFAAQDSPSRYVPSEHV